jgi:hypothetical protein
MATLLATEHERRALLANGEHADASTELWPLIDTVRAHNTSAMSSHANA